MVSTSKIALSRGEYVNQNLVGEVVIIVMITVQLLNKLLLDLPALMTVLVLAQKTAATVRDIKKGGGVRKMVTAVNGLTGIINSEIVVIKRSGEMIIDVQIIGFGFKEDMYTMDVGIASAVMTVDGQTGKTVAPSLVEHGVAITVNTMMFIIREPVLVAVQEVPVLAVLGWRSKK